MENDHYSAEEYEAVWNRIFKVLDPPPKERILWLRPGHKIEVGDFGWAWPRIPRDKEGMVGLTGYDEKMLNIWYAELKLSEVSYVGPKPASFPDGKNTFAVKPPAPSLTLYFARFKRIFTSRWRWWKTRHIRRENLRKYGGRRNEEV